MSDASRNRVLRAVRLLPDAVKIGRGPLDDSQSPSSGATAIPAPPENDDLAALHSAEAEIRKLKAELRDRDASLSEEREAARVARTEMEKLRADVEQEKAAMKASIDKEIADARAAASKEGYEAGHAEGHEAGLSKADAEKKAEYEARFSDALKMLSSISSSLEDAREQLASVHAPQLIRLWEFMLERMLAVHVSLDQSIVVRVLGSILKRVSDRDRVIVYLNPSDVSAVESSKDDLMESIRGVKAFELMSDDHVDRGSCLVETNMGIYDARWRTQLEKIADEVQTLLMESMLSNEPDGNS